MKYMKYMKIKKYSLPDILSILVLRMLYFYTLTFGLAIANEPPNVEPLYTKSTTLEYIMEDEPSPPKSNHK